MTTKTKLELTWPGKQNRPRLEPRILLEDKALSYRVAPAPAADLVEQAEAGPAAFDDNLLIHGDNLLALKALEGKYTGKVKCVYIDPPFNTGEAFENYDDGTEHSTWLQLMRDRAEHIYKLLSDDGSLFVHIDDNEISYLCVLLDEVFGRKNRINIITFRQGSATGHKSINPGLVTTANYILLYAKKKECWKPNRIFTSRDRDERYGQYITNIDENWENWVYTPLSNALSSHFGIPARQLKKSLGDEYEKKVSDFVIQNAHRVIRTARPDYDSVGEAVRETIDASKASPNKLFLLRRDDSSDMYIKAGERWLFYKDKLKIIDGNVVSGEPLTNLWDDILSNNLHKEGGVSFPKGKKPEALIKRILDLCSTPGDLILDSFAGSGTTAAVAHKMKRKWITIELGDQCLTHVLPRLRKVTSGNDHDGISKAVNWQGGGGFRYYRLAPSLLKKDKWGHWVINPEYNGEMLSEAMCKLMGFTYAPSQSTFWRHGRSTETDFIYVTTGSLSHDQLRVISEEVGNERSLLICCKAFMADITAFPNLTLKKIPKTVLHKCEWDHDDYSFSIDVLAEPEPLPEEDDESELNAETEDAADE